MSGTWNTGNLPARPGVYINIVDKAKEQVLGGTRGIVAIPLKTYDVTKASPQTFYSVKSEQDALDKFGSANIESILFALQGGCKEVLVYTLLEIDGVNVTEEIAYADIYQKLEARDFQVFVYDGEVSEDEQVRALHWVQTNRDEGKHFFVVYGGTASDDLDPQVGNARSTLLKDDYTVNLINGVSIDGAVKHSALYAPLIAGTIAATALNKSITYLRVKGDDVNRRLSNSETKQALQAGSLVLQYDGEKVKVEQGITTSALKIRSIKLRHAVQSDLVKTVSDNYIGQINNNADGQKFLISMVKLYLEKLQDQGVLNEIEVILDPNNPPVGDAVYLSITYTEIDSMERVFLSINI